jgi:hypothetical protein
VLASDGSEIELTVPERGGLAASTIGVYHSTSGALEVTFQGSPADSFIAYTDDLGNLPFVVVVPPPS